jgi:hypothetical protein
MANGAAPPEFEASQHRVLLETPRPLTGSGESTKPWNSLPHPQPADEAETPL